ncbi:MAG: DUF4837 family protein [Rikenellaceae bacterium]
MKRVIFALLSVVLICSCDAFRSVTSSDVNSQGAPYELVVVCDYPYWNEGLGDSLRMVLTEPIPYLQQNEARFDILRVTSQGYDNLILKHRNILRTVIDPTKEVAEADVQYDLYAKPQIVVTISAPTATALAEYVGKYGEQVAGIFDMAERDRDIRYAERFNVESLERQIKEMFGFDMRVPKGYMLRSMGDDFLWASYEYPTASQGFLIYQYRAGQGAKALTQPNLVAARNIFTANIPGPSEGSYMTTFMDYDPDYRLFKLEGRVWAELRGFWDVANDFMGGPFVSYSTLDIERGMVVTIDCYVFSPKLGKRNFIRGVENLIYTVNLP